MNDPIKCRRCGTVLSGAAQICACEIKTIPSFDTPADALGDAPVDAPVDTPGDPAVARSGDLYPGRRLNGDRFILRRKLGEGGMGEVWQAVDLQLSEDGVPAEVALKFIGDGAVKDVAAIDLLRAEVRASLQLTHPNILRVHAWHQLPHEPTFFSMEYVDGCDLAEHLATLDGCRMTCAELEPILGPLLDALEYAHVSCRVVHRDIKPANIMLGRDGTVKLADFGIARQNALGSLDVTTPAGTPAFSSPQQRLEGSRNVSDDIYSLAATLYQVLTGELPFSREELLGMVEAGEPTNPRVLVMAKGGNRRDVTPEAAETILRCLSADPARRAPDVATFRKWWKAGPIDPEDEGRNTTSLAEVLRSAVNTTLILGVVAAAVCIGAWIAWDPGLGNWTEARFPTLAVRIDRMLDRWESSENPPPVVISAEEIRQPGSLTTEIGGPEPSNPAAPLLRQRMSPGLQADLLALEGTNAIPSPVLNRLVNELNGLIPGPSLWDPKVFDGVVSMQLKQMAERKPRRRARQIVNRDLIRAALATALKPDPVVPPQETNLVRRFQLKAVNLPKGTPWFHVEFAPARNADGKLGLALLQERFPSGEVATVEGRIQPGRYRMNAWISREGLEMGWISRDVLLAMTNEVVVLDFKPALVTVFSKANADIEVVDHRGSLVAASRGGVFYPSGKYRMRLTASAMNWAVGNAIDDAIHLVPGRYRIRMADSARSRFQSLTGNEEFLCLPGERLDVDNLGAVAIRHPALGQQWTNTVFEPGMQFVPVDGINGFLAARAETTVGDFKVFARETGGVDSPMVSLTASGATNIGRTWRNAFPGQTDRHPVVGVSWDEANSFCSWLTEKTRKVDLIPEGWRFKLPNSEQWAQLTVPGRFPWGASFPPKPDEGNYAREEVLEPKAGGVWPAAWEQLLRAYHEEGYQRDPYPFTCPVDAGGPNRAGFLHVAGNTAEWCDTTASDSEGGQGIPPFGADGQYRIVRGGSWYDHLDPELLRTQFLWAVPAATRSDRIGFRVILVRESNE